MLLSAPRLTRHSPSTMSMSRTEVKVKVRLVRPRRVTRRLKRRLNCPLSSAINDSFSTLYFGVLSNSSATVRFRKSYLCFGGNISVLLFIAFFTHGTMFFLWSMNIYLLFFVLWKGKYFNQLHVLIDYSCAQRLLHYSMEVQFSISDWKLPTLLTITILLQGVASWQRRERTTKP